MATHPISCARKLIQQAEEQGWSTADLAQRIHEHCGHSLLRSYRLAHRWTLDDVVSRIKKELISGQGQPGLNASRVSKWERGDEEPSRKYVGAICRIFDSNPVRLNLIAGFQERHDDSGTDSTALALPHCTGSVASRSAEASPGESIDRRSMLQNLGTGVIVTAAVPLGLGQAIGGLRLQLDETLNASTISDSTVDHWETVADEYGRIYRGSSPLAFLINIVQDITELRLLTDRPLPTAQRRGLCHATARMAGLLATTLLNLGEHREARAWFHTAERAADESEDRSLKAWVLVRHAVSSLYWKDPYGALDLAVQATLQARNQRSVAAAWAPAVQARALALLGRPNETKAALGKAEEIFAQLEIRPTEQHAYGYTEAQLQFYRSSALTELGSIREAYSAQEAALSRYDSHAVLDPTLVKIDHALCLIKDGEIDEAMRYASALLISLPDEHRSPIVTSYARRLTTSVPVLRRSLPSVHEFHEVLALGSSTWQEG